jgi:hypothetical protein
MKRNQQLMAVVAAVAVGTIGAVGVSMVLTSAPPAVPLPPPVVSRDVALGPDGRLSVQFVGDTMLGDAAQPLIDQKGYDWPLQAARESLVGDFAIAVAESPITTLTLPWSIDKEYSYSTRPEAAGALARAGIDAMTLANNHVFDVGPVGLINTISNLEAAGVSAFGAGPDIERAEQPLLLRSELGTLAVIGMGESFGNRAGPDEPGTAEFSPEAIARGAETARLAGADWVIANVHWGDNYQPINGEQRHWAQQFADAAYDMVVGSGSHSAQPIEFIGSMPVVYSVGNFVFGSPGQFDDIRVPAIGLAVGVELSTEGPAQLTVRCLQSDNDVVGFQPQPCSPSEAQANLPALHPELTLHGDVGVIPCGCFVRGAGE